MTLEQLLASMRADGWAVAVHNDYRLDGDLYTFWLFTHAKTGRFVKGEAATDERAVSDAWTMSKIILGLEVIPAGSQDGQPPPCKHEHTHWRIDPQQPWIGASIEVCDDCGKSRSHWEQGSSPWMQVDVSDCQRCEADYRPPPDPSSVADKPIYPLRPGATALLVPMVPQPPDWVKVWNGEHHGEHFFFDSLIDNENGRHWPSYEHGLQQPVNPGDLITTTQGQRRVVAVRAVDMHEIHDRVAIACGYEAGGGEYGSMVSPWTWLKQEWGIEYPGCRWAWLVEVEALASEKGGE